MRLRENSRSANATLTFLPRMRPATRLSFCGETLRLRATALASFSGRLRSRLGLPISLPSSLPDGFLVAAVAVECPGRCELTELVADHVLVDRHRNVLV